MSLINYLKIPQLLKSNKNYKLQLRYFSVTSIKKSNLKQCLAEKIKSERTRIIKFRKKHGATVLGKVTLNSIYGGMRGILGMVWETSTLDVKRGVVFRGYSIPDIYDCLPKLENEPMPEAIFWLLCTGEIPTLDQVKSISKEWAKRSKIPTHVQVMLKNFPKDLHPMSQLSICVTALNKDSKFMECYHSVNRLDFWEYVYEDCMDLIAKLPIIAAAIYCNTYKQGKGLPTIDEDADWGKNYSTMLGYNDPCFIELMRMYLTIHCDHGGGNVSAHATHLVGSALADPYLSFAAGLNGLAGPLHGLANQEVLIWIQNMRKAIGKTPKKKDIEAFIKKGLKAGQVIPGYGHAVLRITDPRYTCQRNFALKYLPDDELFKMVSDLYDIVPPILKSLGKVQNPWPNVDAHSGVLLYHYGMTEMGYYTVLFGVSRALGVLAHAIWSRALLLPIERPNSEPTDTLMEMAKKKPTKKKPTKKKKSTKC